MGLNADGTLIVPKDGVIVVKVDRKQKKIKFIINGIAISFVKFQNGKVRYVSKDKGVIPIDKFKIAVWKTRVILSNN